MYRYVLFLAVFSLCVLPPVLEGQEIIVVGPDQKKIEAVDDAVTQGALRVETEKGEIVECPLKHTEVGASISGFIARVKVLQTFENPFDERIEAVYVFPLPHTAAVDDMTMIIGERRIIGLIKRRAVARRIYEQALAAGQTASLLEQERPNIFTQSVGNIDPGQEIKIEISYVDVLKYDMGVYEFHFPMVVGPRYIPGAPISKKPDLPPELEGKVGEVPDVTPALPDPTGTGWAPDTNRVPDASRITPPVLKPGYRNGHDIALFVTLDAGVPIQNLEVPSHEADIQERGDSRADVRLSPKDSVPNKDFVLRYGVVGEKPQMAVLSHSARVGEGYFMLMMQPKVDEALKEAPPREICFLIDVSGSMSGQPTEVVKAEMAELLHRVKPEDRVQVITFAGSANRLFPQSVPATEENIRKALDFTQAQRGGGGTNMLEGIREVLADPVDPERVRIVIMLTDGFIGNEAEIIKEVGERCGDFIRFWVIGIGSSPNRMLVDGVAGQGGGMGKVLGLEDDPTPLAGEIMERIHRAQLAKIEIDWGTLPVYETYPAKIPELWAGRPVILFARYEAGGESWIKIKGLVEGQPAEFPLYVTLPENEPQHDVLAKVWARKKIADLMVQNYMGDEAVEEEITQIALNYRLMSQFTSFVAVDESEQKTLVEPVNPPRRIPVAIPLPEGVSFEGVFGPAREFEAADSISWAREDAHLWSSPRRQLERSRRAGTWGYMATVQDSSALPSAPMATFAWKGESLQPMVAYHGRSAAGTAGRMTGRAQPLAAASVRRPAGGTSLGIRVAELAETEEFYYAPSVGLNEFQQRAAKYLETARSLLNAASGAETVNEMETAREKLRLAHLLEHSFITVHPRVESGPLQAVVGELEILQGKLIDRQVKEHAELGKHLDLVLRHEKLESALEKIGKAAGIEITLVAGSGEDIRELLLLPDLAITYQDLRGANIAQALTWITAPLDLEWMVNDDGNVIVGTSRRLEGNSAWIYPVGDFLIPTEEELGEKEEDPAKQNEKVQEALKESIDLFNAVAGAFFGETLEGKFEPGTAALVSVDQFLVYGDPNLHERVARFLANLGNPDLLLGFLGTEQDVANIKALNQMTAPRWGARKELRQKRAEAAAIRRVLTSLNGPSWRLLAAASKGDLDPEAAAQLEHAWGSEEIDRILDKGLHVLPYRSLFAITQAARTMPENKDLGKLAPQAVKRALDSFNLPQGEDLQPEQVAAVIYAVLAYEDARELGIPDLPTEGPITEAREWALEQKGKMGNDLPTWLVMKGAPEADPEVLAASIRTNRAAGVDLLVLEALSARRMKGQVWETFRQEAPDLIGSQPMDGEAVVLISRLAATRLPIVKG